MMMKDWIWRKGNRILCMTLTVLLTSGITTVYGTEIRPEAESQDSIEVLVQEAEQMAKKSEADYDGYVIRLSESGQKKTAETKPGTMALAGIDGIGTDLLTADDLEKIPEELNAQDVVRIEPNYIFELLEEESEEIANDPDYLNGKQDYLKTMHVPEIWALGIDGGVSENEKPIRIAVIDSGLNTNHEDMDLDYIDLKNGINYSSEDSTDLSDNLGHGTMVVSEIASVRNNEIGTAGILSKAVVVPIKATDGKTLTMDAVLKSMDYAIDLGVDVINLSMGGADSNSELLKAECQKAVDAGILLIAAAGNKGDDTLIYPAAYDCVIGVGSVGTTSSATTVSTFSERGIDNVFCVAPGYQIRGASYGGSDSYATKNGTSFACPIVTAYAAMIRSLDRSVDQDELKSLIIQTSQDLGVTGRDENYGYGLVDFLEAAETYLPTSCYSVSAYGGGCSLISYTETVPENSRVYYNGVGLYYSARQSCWQWVANEKDSESITEDGFEIKAVSGDAEMSNACLSENGDVNSNRIVNIVDCQCAYTLCKGTDTSFEKRGQKMWLESDVNGDGKMNAEDARMIQYLIHQE